MDGGSGKNILKIRVKTEHITSFLHTTVCIWPRKQTYAVASAPAVAGWLGDSDYFWNRVGE